MFCVLNADVAKLKKQVRSKKNSGENEVIELVKHLRKLLYNFKPSVERSNNSKLCDKSILQNQFSPFKISCNPNLCIFFLTQIHYHKSFFQYDQTPVPPKPIIIYYKIYKTTFKPYLFNAIHKSYYETE